MKRPAVFFDRDNTLIVSDGYLGDPSQVQLVEGAPEAIAKARQYGFKVVTFSNQSGVARGMFDEEAVQAVNRRLDELLQRATPSAVINLHEYCPYHPEASVEKYRQDSDLRKPKPGMLLAAAEKLSLDLSRSWVVGDAPRDIEAGKAAGCRTILFTHPELPKSPAAEAASEVQPDFTVTSLRQAVEIIAREAFKKLGQQAKRPPSPAPAAPSPAPQPPAAELASAPLAVAAEAVALAPAPASALEESEADLPPLEEVLKPAAETPARRLARPRPGVAPAPGPQDASGDEPASLQRVETLLEQILVELKRQREGGSNDFSVSKLLAGIVQIAAVAALILAYMNRESPGLQAIVLFAIALQTLTIALLIMGRQR